MEQKEFYINDDGIKLHTIIDFPQTMNHKCPLVIIVHGFTGNKEERHILAVRDVFLSCGYATLRVDMYGHGLSDGTFENHTLYKWLTNIMTVTDYAKKLEFVEDLYLCGHSQGGLLTILAAGMRPDDYKAIFPLSPALVITEGARNGDLLGVKFDPLHVLEEYHSDTWRLNGNYVRVAQTIFPDKAIERYDSPVLIVHGGADMTVPVEDSIDAAHKYKNCELVIIEGDTHCFDYHLDEMKKAVENFIKRNSILTE